MTRLRWAAFAVALVEVAAFAFLTRDFAVAGLALAAAGVGASGLAPRGEHPRARRAVAGVAAALTLLFAVVLPYERPNPADLLEWPFAADAGAVEGVGFYATPLLVQSAGRLALLFQVGQFFVNAPPPSTDRRRRGMRLAWGLNELFPFYGVAVFFAAGDLFVADEVHRYAQALALLYAAGCIAYLRAYAGQGAPPERGKSRAWGRALRVVPVAALGLAIGWLGSEGVLRYGNRIDVLLANYINPTVFMDRRMGFDETATLDGVVSLKEGGEQVALRVEGPMRDPYFRGRVYDTLWGGRWESTGERRPVAPQTRADGRRAFPLRATGESTRALQVESRPDLAHVVFHPLEAQSVVVGSERMQADWHGNLALVPEASRYTLRVGGAGGVEPLSARQRALLTTVPDEVAPEARAVAAAVGGESARPQTIMARVAGYFQQAYGYSLEVQTPPGEHPLVYFLRDRPGAHCEYFAAAATMVLRAAGVPARYVTGFVVAERNAVGDYHLARSRHAHAWCEAWDPAAGWLVVEATPAEGVPQPQESQGLRAAWQLLKEGVRSAWASLKAWLIEVVRSGWGAAALAVAAAVCVWLAAWLRRWWKVRKGKPAARPVVPLAPEVRALRALLQREDRRLAAAGIERRASETMTAFASRLRAAGLEEWAAWYHAYERTRFGAPVEAEEVERLAAQAPKGGPDGSA